MLQLYLNNRQRNVEKQKMKNICRSIKNLRFLNEHQILNITNCSFGVIRLSEEHIIFILISYYYRIQYSLL